MRRIILPLAALTVLVAGCQGRDTAMVTEPVATPSQASLDRSASGSYHVAGGGTFAGDGTSDVKYSVEAKMTGAGVTTNGWYNSSASGQFEQSFSTPAGKVDFTAEVTCLSVDMATHHTRIGGRIARNRSTDPDYVGDVFNVGHDVWFRIEDNGHGKAAPDRSTYLGFEGGIASSADYCALQSWSTAVLHDVLHGEINVLQ